MSGTARYSTGERVRVRLDWPEAGPKRVHIRTPHYLRGRSGVVERVFGAYPNPETLAFGQAGQPPQPLYQIRFAQAPIWEKGAPADTIVAIYEHWLELEEARHG
jgi:hypothetical protein